jgi:DNA-binding GntR family transcriptional regulator
VIAVEVFMASEKAKTSDRKQLSLRQKIYKEIKKEIITCQLEPGLMLSESTFAERFNVSKTPVREAITSLEHENLVTYIPNKGFHVTNISVKDIQEIFEARLFFESILFELALKNITPPEISKLEEYNNISYDWKDLPSIDRYLQANIEFHMGFAKAAHNSRLYRLFEMLLNEAQRLIYMDFKENNVLETWHISHKRFTDALRERDAEKGLIAIREVTENGKRRMLGY